MRLRFAGFEVTGLIVPAVVTGRRIPHSDAWIVADGELDAGTDDHADHPDIPIS
ncbi:hypothetical protein [Halosimplex pelagicum]|uniref:Uncharacterized protein n=1 Tax=Halosimplex pelagicum TaxID=869886 RepID=A0A7D5TD28_9EURY|nr:hypothetical protein [Halosimplex pelagicum]QLH83429.1 hypothetical protein HZS54_18115 [Halosimplex pelagicum]